MIAHKERDIAKFYTNSEDNIVLDERQVNYQETKNSKFYADFDDDIFVERKTSFEFANLQTLYTIDENFICVICKHLLNETCQMECGCRSCYTCLKDYLDSGSTTCPIKNCESYTIKRLMRDKAWDREMKAIKYKCINSDCRDMVSLLDFYEHRAVCQYTVLKCRNCQMKVQRLQKAQHNLKECFPEADNDIHSLIMSYSDSHASPSSSKIINNIYDQGQGIYVKLMLGMISKLRADIEQQKQEHESTMISLNELEVFENNVETIRTSVDELETEFKSMYSNKQLTMGVYDQYIWRISDYDKLIDSDPFIESSPFYTDLHGYKVVLKLYPNGDGNGKGEYVSLYMALLKGKYDNLLKWPFHKTFTITILNKQERKNKCLRFKPNSSLDNFKRPQTDPYPATGEPKFIRKSAINSENYLYDKALFIKFKIEN